MTKVMQIRDVPDEVHDALTRAAHDRGQSLTKYMLAELEHLARRPKIVADNAAVIRRTQDQVQADPDRETIVEILREGRGD